MSVMLDLSCDGCDATERVGPLLDDFVSVSGRSYGIGGRVVRDPKALTPDGWVMWDPYTGCTYCPDCWALIGSGDREGADRLCGGKDAKYAGTCPRPEGHAGPCFEPGEAEG